MKSLVVNYKNLNYKDFCYILNSATLLEASECCGQNCQECDFFRARAGFLPCAGWYARIMLPYPIGGWYRRQPLQHVWLIGSRRCIGSGSAAMCPWCRCSASRKHDIAVLIPIVRTAKIKPPVYQCAQSRWSRFKEKLRKFALANWLHLDFAWASFVLTP